MKDTGDCNCGLLLTVLYTWKDPVPALANKKPPVKITFGTMNGGRFKSLDIKESASENGTWWAYRAGWFDTAR